MNKYTLNDLSEFLTKWENFSCKPSFKKLKEGTVVDENKTVKWNREQVQENNDKYEKALVKLNREKNKLFVDFRKACCQYVIDTADASEKQALNVFEYLQDRCSNYNELVNELPCICNLLSF